MIAGAAHKIVKAGAFAAEDNDEIACEIKLVVWVRAAFIETNNPEVAALELFERANKVDNAGDAEVLSGSGAGFDGGGAEWSGTALGKKDAVDSGTIGDAKKSAEVLRIFNTIEREQKPSGRFAGGIGLEEIFEGEKFLRANERDDALMCGSLSGERELLARFLKDTDTRLAALGDDLTETVVFALAGDKNVIEAAPAGLESFRDRMQAVENFHGISLERETQRAPKFAAPG